MKVRTNDLRGRALEWVIAQIQGDTEVTCPKCEGEGRYTVHGTGWTEDCSCGQCNTTGVVKLEPSSPMPPYLSCAFLMKQVIEKHKPTIKWLPRQQEWCVTTYQYKTDGFTSGLTLSKDLAFAIMNSVAQHIHGDVVEIPDEVTADMKGS
ncbi:hypothetical protein ATN89_17710 [Comamonas thiooxydans]|uniref:hypothetical protein n=1 Tax=Comamonas thiooxydans TaxID=363952 RepID=UPI0007C4A1C2|nr:hypothetical protein [Comamonas thiooxydans]OAD82919.1 hypothetical protein ATN89_17710 [Comamonas thiooxydans]